MSDEGGGQQHWSGTFQRLRAEVVILALLVLAMTQIDVSLTKIPLVGIELRSPAPRGALLAFLYSFLLYFVFAWFWRYRAERAEALLPLKQLQSFINRIDAQVAGLEKLEPPDPSGAVSSASDARKRLDGYSSELDRMLRQHTSSLERLVKDAKSFLDAPVIARADLPQEGPVQSLRAELRSFLDFLQNPNLAVKHVPNEVRSYVQEVLDTLEEQRKALVQELEEKGPKISDAAVVFRKEMADFQRRIYRRAGALFWDREVLGFYVPFAFALGLAVFTVPQGISDLAPVIGRAKQCITTPEMSCFYRISSSAP